MIYDKKKDAPQRSSSSMVPSLLNDTPFADSVPQDSDFVKRKFSVSSDSSAESHFAVIERQMREQNADPEAQSESVTGVNQGKGQVSERRYQANHAQLSSTCDFTKPFYQQVKDYKNGIFPKGDSLILGETPEILRKIGFNALPLTINQTHERSTDLIAEAIPTSSLAVF